jgi:lipoyl-dependent peroxiredoxin
MNELQNVAYTAKATATGGREGVAKSDDGRLNVNLSTPKGFGGDDGSGTNPKQLFQPQVTLLVLLVCLNL